MKSKNISFKYYIHDKDCGDIQAIYLSHKGFYNVKMKHSYDIQLMLNECSAIRLHSDVNMTRLINSMNKEAGFNITHTS